MIARSLCLSGLLLALSAVSRADEKVGSIAGLGPTGEVTKVQGGFQFTEGPAADKKGQIYFSDIPANHVYRVGSDGKVSIFREASNHTNGTMFNSRGELVSCEMDGQVVAVSADGSQVRPLAPMYKGKRFNAPNDLVVDGTDGVYFTDPHFRAPEPLPQGVAAVYYASKSGDVTRLIDDLKAPNGVILSTDEKTLYVVPSMQEEVMAYPVESPGKLGAGKVLCRMKQPQGQQGRGGDGLTIDIKGNLYIATGLGLQVFDRDGKHLGIIEVPEPPANVTFGGAELKTLYITARTSLYRADMEATGHRFAQGGK
ncbi:MAG TPA: SMP-30/gluconolactonase/LRE family protein [Pirellulales bacterium]|jgi:gluconolactonase|nr:SMP-30/gluconolactonase/LRE family protein [Pirellulales bacterium]